MVFRFSVSALRTDTEPKLTQTSSLPSTLLYLLSPIRRLGSLGGMDLHLLRIAVCRTCLDFSIDSLEYRYQAAIGLYYCAFSIGCSAQGGTDRQAGSLKDASIVRVRPKKGKGKGEMIPLETKTVGRVAVLLRGDQADDQTPGSSEPVYLFVYQRDTYVWSRMSAQPQRLEASLIPSFDQDFHPGPLPM